MNVRYASDDEVRDSISSNPRAKAILPIGSLEQHGMHLPLSTDTIIAEYIALKVGERLDALVLPPINYGISYEHRPLFNISIGSITLARMIEDICSSLVYNGVKRIIILNGHYGNEHAILSCIKEISARHKVMLASIPYWAFIDGSDHAGIKETSLMLAIDSKYVRVDKVSKGKDLAYSIVLENLTLLEGSMVRLTGNGIVGDASKANLHKGREMLNIIIDGIVEAIGALESMYEQYINEKS